MKRSVINSGLLPSMNYVKNIDGLKVFSHFCDVTCDNIFAFSPYDLNIEREEFLQFQCLADELKDVLDKTSSFSDELMALSNKIYNIYKRLLNNCWDAFVDSCEGNVDAGKLIALQLIAVENFESSVKSE